MSEQVGIGIWESKVIGIGIWESRVIGIGIRNSESLGIEENSPRDSKRRVNFTGLNHF